MIRLPPLLVEKPWGRTSLPAPFEAPEGQRIGEIWFPAPADSELPLLVKYLFTAEKLSIQVHPSDEQARARGLPAGKEECWYILDAEPGARLGIGTARELDASTLRHAAQTGEIEQLMQWHAVEPGMLFHIPPGTVHAIGAGISLIEIQQASDVTYRLYDYGRPRELHLADGIDVAKAAPFPSSRRTSVDLSCSAILLETPHFTLAQVVDGDEAPLSGMTDPGLVIPLTGEIRIDDSLAGPGECLIVGEDFHIEASADTRMLVAWTARDPSG